MCIRHEHHQRKTAVWQGNLNWEPEEPKVTINPRSRERDESTGHYHSTIVEIADSTQSVKGRWYPTKRVIQHHGVNKRNERVAHPNNNKTETLYIDTQGQIDPVCFNWPSELPLPTK